MDREPGSFATLLRQLRTAAALSQEALAERAGLSPRGISDLERGVRRTPRLSTVRMLADALNLNADDRRVLLAAARPDGVTEPQSLQPPEMARLPVALTALIGRDSELAVLTTLLRQDATRLVTLTGPGGVGKTRLALEVGARLLGEFDDGVAFVDLGRLSDPALVLPVIAGALGVRERAGRSLMNTLAGALALMEVIVLLDNCEHVLAAAAGFAALLAHCPRVSILATSREPLRVRGEHVVPLKPLSLPGAPLPGLAALVDVPAVALFVERAVAHQPDFALTAENAAAVAAICRRLDGLPLAIELAAVRTPLLPPDALLARLERSLPLLTAGSRDLPARQRTLRDAIAWSYALLPADERALLRRLSVFVGGWTLEAAEAVADPDGCLDILDALGSMIDKSLVRRFDPAAGDVRFGMLATIGEFAREQLTEAEADEARAAHASFYLALANAAGPELRGGAQQQWLEMLARERDNLREALLWTASHGDRDRGFDAASQLWLFWWVGGALTEGLRICAELLDGEDEAPDSAARGQALFAAGMLAWAFGDPEAAEARHRESLAVGQRLDDPSLQANALLGLAMAASGRGDYAASLGLHEASLALRADVDAPWETSVSLHNLGWTTHEQGDLVAARPRYEQALALRRDLHDHRGVMITLWCLGDLDQDDGDLGGARVRYREALEIARELNDRWTIRLLLGSLARLALAMQQPERALRLIGAVEALENSLGIGLLPQWRAALEHVRCAAETSVGPKAAETIAEGRSLPLPEAVAAGLAIAGS